jgi:hypothetical protein
MPDPAERRRRFNRPVGGLGLAFPAGPPGSLPLAMATHRLANFLFPMILPILAAVGAVWRILCG